MTVGIFSLTKNNGATDLAITTAATSICDPIIDLDGMLGVSLTARLAYGSGGTSIKVFVQSSTNGGSTWRDVWCATFTTASADKGVNLSGLTPKTTAVLGTDGTLADDTVVDGILGDRLRCKVVTTGTYAGSTVLEVRASVR